MTESGLAAGYLAVAGPKPLRYLSPSVAPATPFQLPPLAMDDNGLPPPVPSPAEPASKDTASSGSKPAADSRPPASGTPSTPSVPTPKPEAAVIAAEPLDGSASWPSEPLPLPPETVLTPQMLVPYFMGRPGTNGYPVVFPSPGFLPPLPPRPPSSTATYTSP